MELSCLLHNTSGRMQRPLGVSKTPNKPGASMGGKKGQRTKRGKMEELKKNKKTTLKVTGGNLPLVYLFYLFYPIRTSFDVFRWQQLSGFSGCPAAAPPLPAAPTRSGSAPVPLKVDLS